MSAFKIWHTQKYRNFSESFRFELEDAWNAAIDEAIKVVIEEDSDDYIAGPVTKFLIKEIKELKD